MVYAPIASIRWFAELGLDDIPLVGGKNASPGELYRALSATGVHVPPGFAITADAYRAFLHEAHLDQTITAVLRGGAGHDATQQMALSAGGRKMQTKGIWGMLVAVGIVLCLGRESSWQRSLPIRHRSAGSGHGGG